MFNECSVGLRIVNEKNITATTCYCPNSEIITALVESVLCCYGRKSGELICLSETKHFQYITSKLVAQLFSSVSVMLYYILKCCLYRKL